MREVRSVSVVLSAKIDRFKADMALAGKTAVDAAQKTETAWDNSSTTMGKALRSAQQYEQEMGQVGGVMATFGGVVVGSLGLATKASMAWESAWTGVLKTVNGTPKELAEIESGLRQLAKTMPATHEEIAGVAEAAGQLGVKTKDIVSFTKTMIDLGESTNLTAEEAATSIAQIANVMGTTGKDISRFGSALVKLGNNGASTEKDILDMAQRLAGAGKLAGASESDILALSNTLASVGVKAELGGGVMSRVMNRMYTDVKNNGEGLQDLARVAGVSSKEFAAAFEADPVRAVSMITEGLNGVKESGGNVVETMSQLGIKGTEETQVMLSLAGAGNLLTESLDMGNKAWEANNALAEEAAKRYQTSESRIKIAGNQIRDTAIEIGGTFAPAVAGVVEALGGFIGMIGDLPDPVIKFGAALAGIGGAGALAAGGVLLLAPKVAETVSAFNTLRTKVNESTGSLSKFQGAAGRARGIIVDIGKVAGIATGYLTAMSIAAAFDDKEKIAGAEEIGQAMLGISSGAKGASDALNNAAFGNAVETIGNGKDAANDFGEALDRVNNKNFEDRFNGWVSGFTGFRTDIGDTEEALKAADQTLTGFVQNGNLEQAGAGFAEIARQGKEAGYGVDVVAKSFPEYIDALRNQATQLGITLTEQELLNWAMGEVPAKVTAAAGAAGPAAEAISGIGGAAQDTAMGLQDMLNKMFALGLANLSERESMRQYEDAVRGVSESIKENGTSLDITTAKGSANQAAFDAIADAGFRAAQSMADNGASQEDVQNHLQNTYDDLVSAANQFGATGKEAEDMAREVMGIPDGVDIKTWMSDNAKNTAQDTSKEVSDLDKQEAKPTVKADTKDADKKLKETNGFMKWLKENSTVTIKVWSSITEFFGGASKGSKPKPGSQGNGGRYWGGIDVKPMADGGMLSPIAQVVKPNTWRLVGDRLDVDEAFIPLDGSQRSWKILMQALSRMPGTMPMARGGIASAQSGVDAAQDRLRAARREKSDAKSQKAKQQAERRIRVAEDELAAAKKSLKSAKDRQKSDEQAAKLAADRAKEEKERQKRVSELRNDMSTSIRRGSVRDSVTGSLSGGYSMVDQLFNLGKNEDLSRGSRSRATTSARKFESNLKNLYGQAERIDAKLKSAQDKAQELKGIKDTVASSLLGGRDLDVGTTQTRVNGQWVSQSNLGDAARGLKMDVGAMKSFAEKLKKLAQMGIPGAIIQKIAQAGVENGSNMADAFLGATAAERKSYVGAWKDYERYANDAGQYVTEGFYKGGANAAAGVVKGLEGQKKNVETAIANLAKAIESTFRNVLGIRSPSTVMEKAAFWVPEAARLQILDAIPGIQAATAQMSAAMIPSAVPNSMAFEVSATPVVSDDTGEAGLAMQSMSATTVDSMSQMQAAVTAGWAEILAQTQSAQAGMLANTQLQQNAMLTNTQLNQQGMLTTVQTQQEAMRASIAGKQLAARTNLTTEQELMRATMADKQLRMKDQSASDFESMKSTTGRKLNEMRSNSSNTMEGMRSDQWGKLESLKANNREGFESMKRTSNSNMSGIRSGMRGELEAARPEVGGKLNRVIDVFGSFSSSVNKAFGDVGVKLSAPSKLKYADGGVLPGYSPGYDDYRFTAASGRTLELSGGEGIIRPEGTSVLGTQWIEGINYAARTGGKQGVRDWLTLDPERFAKGGTLMEAADWWIARKAKPSRHSRFNGGRRITSGHSRNSLHYQDRAVDLNYAAGTSAYEMGMFDKYLPSFKAAFPNIRTIWRAPGHYNHLHIDTGRGGDIGKFTPGGGGGAMPDFHPFLDRAGVTPGADMQESYERAAKKLLAGIAEKHRKMLPPGFSGELANGVIQDAVEGLVKKAGEYGKNASAGGADFSNVANGPIKQMARQMLEAMGWGDQWPDLNWLLTKESSWNPNAQNPVSTAYGLFQFLNSTWSTVGGKKTSDPRLQLEYGLKYIKQRYGDVRGARRFWERNRWYEGGTRAAQSGLAVVGENGPELIDLRGSERIHNAQQTRKLLAENRTFIPAQRQTVDTQALTQAMVSAVQSQGVRPEDLAAAFDGVTLVFQADGQQFTGAVTAVVGNGYDQSRSRMAKNSQKIGAVR